MFYEITCFFFDGSGKNILRGGKRGARGREVGVKGEGSGGKGEEAGDGDPPVHPHIKVQVKSCAR